MTNEQPALIPAAEATRRLGFKHRSSLTRLVQQGKITPAFAGSGKTGEQFFRPEDIDRVLADRAAAVSREAVAS